MAETTHKVEYLTGLSNLIPNKALGEIILVNMREIGAPTYTEEELEFAKTIGKTVPLEQKRDALRSRKLPNWEQFFEHK